jgi:hypothetical protein
MEAKINEDTQIYISNLQNLNIQVQHFKTNGEVKKLGDYRAMIAQLQHSLNQAEADIEELHGHQKLLDLPLSDFGMLEQSKEQLRPYDELWSLADEKIKMMQIWNNSPALELNAEQVEKDALRITASATQLQGAAS